MPKPSFWSTTVTVGAQKVYAYERPDCDGVVYVRYSHPQRTGRDRRVKERVPGDVVVRDVKGRVDPKLVRAAVLAVQQYTAPLLAGSAPAPAQRSGGLTLAEGFDLALDLATGKYPTKSLRWQEVDRARKKLLQLLGSSKQWVDVSPADARKVWRTLANRYVHAPDQRTATGPRQTEVTLDALYSVANWLRDEGHIPSTACLPTKQWRAKLKAEWEHITGEQAKPQRPRHTPDELRRLFEHMHDAAVDPRFALAFDLGGEQRIGQVLRSRRSDLELPPYDAAAGVGALGLLRVRGNDKKPTQPVYLTAEQREAVERALAGYLSRCEQAWRTGELEDYWLFPAGRFKQGRAKVGVAKPLTRDAALKMFHELEQVAKVPPVPGRGWYGVKRVATDLAEDVEKDERVLNAITGHRDSATRRQIYQEGERPEVLIRAAETRAKVRTGGG